VPEVPAPRIEDQGFFVVCLRRSTSRSTLKGRKERMSILWIILIVILVLALLGFFSRGRW
jgi:hypothetical protein